MDGGSTARFDLGSDVLMDGGSTARFDLGVLCPSTLGISEDLGQRDWLTHDWQNVIARLLFRQILQPGE